MTNVYPSPSAPGLAFEEALRQGQIRATRSRQQRHRASVFIWQAVFLVAFFTAWALASGRIVDRLFVSDPASVGAALYRLLITGDLWYHLRFTLIEALGGYVAGVTFGLGGALGLSLIPSGEPILRPFIMLFYATPKIALAPLIVLWFGLGTPPKILLAAMFVFLVVFLNTLRGLASVSPGLIAMARVMGATRSELLLKLALPSAMPFIIAALRITIPAAVIGAVVGEYISSNRGVGYLILAASGRYNTAQAFGGIVSLLLVVSAMNIAVSSLERSWLRWAPPPPSFASGRRAAR